MNPIPNRIGCPQCPLDAYLTDGGMDVSGPGRPGMGQPILEYRCQCGWRMNAQTIPPRTKAENTAAIRASAQGHPEGSWQMVSGTDANRCVLTVQPMPSAHAGVIGVVLNHPGGGQERISCNFFLGLGDIKALQQSLSLIEHQLQDQASREKAAGTI